MEFINLTNQQEVRPLSPETEIIICAGVPWDNQYKHVRLYSSREELHNFIVRKKIFETFTNAPVKRGYLNLSVNIDEYALEKANYIAFRTKQKGEDWQYAFITRIFPLNVNSARVVFELDVWTNNQFDIKLNKCYIERELVAKSKDVIGRYTMPEGLELGEYVLNKTDEAGLEGEYYAPNLNEQADEAVFITTYDENGKVTEGFRKDGVYNCMSFHAPEYPNNFIKQITELGLSEGIIEVIMFPKEFLTEDDAIWKTLRIPKAYATLDGYAPKNNKLFCYPYNVLYANNGIGSSLLYRYELFGSNHGQCEFEYTVNLSSEPACVCVPRDYKKITQNFNETISYNGYPKCPIAIDSFKAYLAQSGSYRLVNKFEDTSIPVPTFSTLSNVVGSVLKGENVDLSSAQTTNTPLLPESEYAGATVLNALLSGNPFSGIKQATRAAVQPPASRGAMTSYVSALINRKCVTFRRMCIQREYAEKIDNFFSIYGYLIGEIGTPDINSRQTWNFTKTQGCAISGNIQSNQLQILRSIFDSGVWVWHTDDVGNFSLPN